MKRKLFLFLVLLFSIGIRSDATDRTFGAWGSGVLGGSCPAGQFVIAVNVGAGPTCSGPLEIAIPSPVTTVTLNAGSQRLSGILFLPGAHTLVRVGIFIDTAGVGCTTAGTMNFYDLTTGTFLSGISLPLNPVVGNIDSGVFSQALTAGHNYQIIQGTAYAGCTTFPTGLAWAVYQ